MPVTRCRSRIFDPGCLGIAVTWMPMKDRDTGDKLWTCVAGSSSGGETLSL